MRQSLKDILRDEGLRGFYRGVLSSVVQIAPYMGILFGTYETTRTVFTKHNRFPPRTSDFLAGGVSGIVSKCAVFPLDTVRKRLQVQGPTREKYIHKDIPLSKGIIHCTTEIIRRDGLRGLYKGLGVALLKSGPSAAVTLWVFDGSIRIWEWMNDKSDRGNE